MKTLGGDETGKTYLSNTPSQAPQQAEDMHRVHRLVKPADMMTPPDEERRNLLDQTHLLGHFGADAIVNALHADGIHWQRLKEDALETVKRCPECLHFNIAKHGYHPLKSITANLPGDHWAIDLAGPFATSHKGNNYLLVMVDICSRFCLLRAIPDKTSLTIADQLINIFCDFGLPKILQSDNGKEFVNELVKLFTEKAGIDHRLVTPYHPRANGVAEKWVHTAKEIINKRLNGAKKDWDIYVPSTQLAMNCKYASLHNSRPFALMFARQPNDFQDFREVTIDEDHSIPDAPNTIDRIEQMENIVFPAIREKIQAVQAAERGKFDKNHRIINEFPPGSHVAIKNVHRSSKADPRYDGPFTVKGKSKGGSYILEDDTGALLTRDIPPSHLKLLSHDTVVKAENVYEVQAIIDHKGTNGNYLYRVRWKDYKPEDDTWEPPSNFDDKRQIERYWQRRSTDQNGDNNKNQAGGDHDDETRKKRPQPQNVRQSSRHKRQRTSS